MAKLIRCKVTDEYVQGAGVVIGAAGSHNDVTIELAFSEIWEDTTKQVVWHNALGQNPTIILLTLDMRTEEGSYLVSVPFEAKEIEGDCSMTVKGAKTDGEVETFATLTTTAYFRVLPSAWDANAEKSEDLTPSQAVSIQNQIDVLLDKIEKAVEAGDAADEAIAAKNAAVTAAGNAHASANGAEESATAAYAAQKAAEKARDEAQSIVGGDYIPNGGAQVEGDYELTGNLYSSGQISAQGLISSDSGIATGGDIVAERDVHAGLYYVGGNLLTETITMTVTTDWLADDVNGGYLQMVELDGILATDNPIADVVMGDDVAANELYAKAWSCITRIFTEDDMVTLYANKEAPTTAFTVQLKVVR